MSDARPATPSSAAATGLSMETGAVADFGVFYRATVRDVTAFFARRCAQPQLVADLTSEVFVQAIASLGTFDPDRGSARAWLFGIVRRVWAQHCERTAKSRAAVVALAARRELDDEEIEELAARIDAQEAGRQVVAELEQLSDVERAAVELVDLAGLAPREAASVLDISAGVLRVRLFRARKRLRKTQEAP